MWICCVTLGILPTVVSKTPQDTTRLLQELYERTGGGNWNYTGIVHCLKEIKLQSYIGEKWNFTTNAEGEYLLDPCSKARHFIGLNCTNESIINGIALPCGDLIGTIPELLGQLTGLQLVVLGVNQLSGTIPELLGQLMGLKELDLGENQLSGTIPELLGQLTELQSLTLGSNCLSGTIPQSICSLHDLIFLELTSIGGGKFCREYSFVDSFFGSQFNGFTSSTYLAGTIPECVWGLRNLTSLYASGNRLSGSIPDTLGVRLQNISLSYNHFDGSLPESLTKYPNMSIELSHNRIRGDLSVFESAKDIKQLNASVNRLSGSIPKSLLHLGLIDILAGNEFDCLWGERYQLPSLDPSVNKYQCGSNLYNVSFYLYLVIAFLGASIVWYLYQQVHCTRRCNFGLM